MIWNSVAIMTVTDIAIIGGVGYALNFLITSWRHANDPALRAGFFAIIGGFAVAASFHAMDLIVRYVLPAILDFAPEIAQDTRLTTYSLFTLACFGSVVFGLTKLGRSICAKFEEQTISNKLAMAALQKSELHFRHLVEGSLQGISISDGEKRLFVNQAYADMLGYGSPEEVMGQLPYLQPFMSTEKKDVRTRVQDRLNHGGQGQPFETEMVRKNGATINVLIMVKAIEWRGRAAVLATLVDITEQIKAQHALQASEENFRRIVELSDQGFCIHDGFKPVFANSAVTRIFGYDSVEELLALPSLLSLIPKYEHQRATDYDSNRRNNKRVPGTYEIEGVKKDGTTFWIQLYAQKVIWEGQELVGVTATDISERKYREQALTESHKLLQSLIDGMPEFVALKNANDEYLFVNRVFEQWYGVPREQVASALGAGRDVIIKADVQGAATIRKMVPEALSIFLAPPGDDELKNRLNARMTESAEALALRLETAKAEMEQAPHFDRIVVNHSGRLDDAVREIEQIVAAEKLRIPPRRVSL